MLRIYENVAKLRENGRKDLVHWPNYNIIHQKGISGINDDKVFEESEDNRGHEILQVPLNGNDFHAINFSEDFKIKYGFWKIFFLILIILILVIALVCCYRYLYLKLWSVYQRMSLKRSTESLSNQERDLLKDWIVPKKDDLHEDFEPLINQEKNKLFCNEEDRFETQESLLQSDGDRTQIVMKDLATDLIFETQEKESFSETFQNSIELQQMEPNHEIMNEFYNDKLEIEKVSTNDAIINIPITHNKSNLQRSLSACDINRICIIKRKYSDPGLQLIDAIEVCHREICNHFKELSSPKIEENTRVEQELFEPPRIQQFNSKHEGAGESLNDFELTKNYDNLSMLLSHRMKQQIHPCQRKYCLLARHLRKKGHHDERKCQLWYTCYAHYLADQAANCNNGNICEDTYDEFEMMRVAPDQRKRLNRIIHERRRRFLG
ncbi:uncharacterized protein LOC107274415 isoform X2 [Cephus cinctus]|uniref:Uncharacterized protein LOC107274415 isoform X2 n=1 Tax=Cephus cinctus TaxID=211228 RepID=A0AAJ7RVY6_CEPCN|nr:uncharacterized protein LOC107274415 isoform X2 [Cephus cinctus]